MPELQRQSIINGSVAVQATGYIAYPVTVDASTMVAPRVVGRVTASGGSGNDIEVVVFSETQYINWKNNHKQGSLFTSGKVTVTQLNVRLGETGTYYVMFSNVFSAFTSKTVEGKVDLEWTPPVPTQEEQEATQAAVFAGAGLILLVLLVAGGIGGLVVWWAISRKKQVAG